MEHLIGNKNMLNILNSINFIDMHFGRYINALACRGNQLIEIALTLENLPKVILFLSQSKYLYANGLVDIFATDFTGNKRNQRFHLNYLFRAYDYNTLFRLTMLVSEVALVPSITSLFKGANWLEREIWDMFGIFFVDHSDLRRILTDYGFEGHPLRKDFPLSGYTEVRYDDEVKKVNLEPLNVIQEFRYFDFINPWYKNKT